MTQNNTIGVGSTAKPAHGAACTRADWTPEAIARYWDYWANRNDRYDRYFTHRSGEGVKNFAKFAGVLRGNILDYGCGPGFLISHLLKEADGVWGADYSAETVARVNERYAGGKKWRGAVVAADLPTALPEAFFNLSFCVETFEHLSEEVASAITAELWRVTKSGGAVIITTPNDETLYSNYVYCPFCNTEFHEYQHMRSISVQSLTEFLSTRGFEVRFCQPIRIIDFHDSFTFPPILDCSINALRAWGMRKVYGGMDILAPRPPVQGRLLRALARRTGAQLFAVGIKK